MENHKNNVWIGTDQLNNNPELAQTEQAEFKEKLPMAGDQGETELRLESNRRDFLKYLGFGIGAATIAACDIPVRKAIPYVIKPDSIIPGVATYFATSFVKGGDYCPILVKTREGRPIKIEGNTLSSMTKGGTSAKAQASILSLYDTSRFDSPIGKGEAMDWVDLDKAVMTQMSREAKIRIVANTIMSPTAKKAIADFKVAFPLTEVVMYDSVSSSAILQANEASFRTATLPSYHFDKADVIVAIDCDFLGGWVSPTEFARQYANGRRVNTKHPKMSRHIQVESYMSLSGSNADNRVPLKPSEIGAFIVALYNKIAVAKGVAKISGPKLDAKKDKKAAIIAKEMVAAPGKSLLVSGSNNKGEQILVNGINEMLGNYGRTLSFERPLLTRQGDAKNNARLIKEMSSKVVDILIVMDGANPAYNFPDAVAFREAMANVNLRISLSGTPNETSEECHYIAPTHHYLESWGDVEPKGGVYSLLQPTISPIFASVGRAGTRHGEESLLVWAKSSNLDRSADQPYLEYLKDNWKANMFTLQSKYISFDRFWDASLHDGVFEAPINGYIQNAFVGNVTAAVAKVRKPASSDLEITFYETINMGGGEYANNPWLQELPDPITRCVWGNYLAIPVQWDGGNSWSAMHNLNPEEFKGKADDVMLTVAESEQKVTCVRQFGQPNGTTALALGYGRSVTGMVGRALGNKVGTNVHDWLKVDADGNVQYYATNAAIAEDVVGEDEFACVQYHHTMGVTARNEDGSQVMNDEGSAPLNVDEKTIMTIGTGFQGSLTNRSIIYQGKLDELHELEEHIAEKRAEADHLNKQTLYPFDQYTEELYSQGHHWAMHVDLNACIGCGACQVACMAENNVPVVGKREVYRHHEMTWMRIDRYYYGDYENPKTVYQPMMCQHCDNAPCENVCPVAATNHSSEGLNQMTYNRCIGTRYCANNCPFKVRRFNWLDYTTGDLFGGNEYPVSGEEVPYGADNLTRMVLNPDVTVRSRGVIEKCSFCVQRIQEGKLTAKKEGRRLESADVRSACQTACPTEAIVFGDRNDKHSDLAKRLDNPLNYLVLEEINVQTSVYYSARVNNSKEELEA